MVGGGTGAELRRRGFRIGATEILLLLSRPCSSLDGTIGGLDVPFSRCCRRLSWALEWTTTARYGVP